MAGIRQMFQYMGMEKPDAYTPYAAGRKMYSTAGGAPNGATQTPQAAAGYNARDMKARAKRNAMLRYMQKGQAGNYASSDYLGGSARGWHNSGGV
jgi:hypothetical protein